MLDIHALMKGLAERRPVFHNEADFQFALASYLREECDQPVRPEWRPCPEQRMDIDLWLPKARVAIELKYSTRALRCDEYSADLDPPCESFSLRDRGARDITRYDFLKDVGRLERVLARRPEARRGIAILLTNDPLYWEKRSTETIPIDEDFHLHDGRALPRTPNQMHWVEGAKTAKFRNVPVVLNGSYAVEWKCYGVVKPERDAQYGAFRYLVVEVSRSSAGAPAGESPTSRPGCAPSA